MKNEKKNLKYRKIALILSLCAIVIWSVLGTGASLAWFSDETPEINNIFHFGEFESAIYMLKSNGEWELIDGSTDIFDSEALYEPGYTEVVKFKLLNKCDYKFKLYTAVNVNDSVAGINAFGQSFNLYDYLKFGIKISSTESEMQGSIESREEAASLATEPLHSYSNKTKILKPNEEAYITMVIHMPEEVDNVANYRDDKMPYVELGVTFALEQTK